MKMKLKLIICTFAFLSIVGWGSFSILSKEVTDSTYWMDTASKAIRAQASNLDPEVLKLGLTAYLKARKRGLDEKQILTLVDYSKSSSEQRLWVIDLKNLKVLFNTWVAHGKNSGKTNATSFSNKPASLKSSIGVFVTDETYSGKRGYSLRIKGLEKNINDNAYDRNIVFHGASYVNKGVTGRSHGCFAVNQRLAKPLIDTIKKDTLVVAYYPDQYWKTHSDFTKDI
jgi:hypothetical protein